MMDKKYAVSYIKSVLNEDKIQFQTIPALLKKHATLTPDKEAFVFLSTEKERQSITWKDVYYKSQILAKSIVQLGVKPKEIVAISYRTCPEWIFTNFGVMMAGAIPLGLSFTYEDGSDVVAMMKLLKTCSALFFDPKENNCIWKILKTLLDYYDENGNVKSSKMPFLRYLVSLLRPEEDTLLTIDDLIKPAKEDTQLPNIELDDIMGLFQTSGSTGVPKVIAHSHRYYNYLGASGKYLESGPNDIIYNDRPFDWMGGYPDNMYQGETRVTRSGMCKPPKDDMEYLYEAIMQERCTCVMLLASRIDVMCKRNVPDHWPIKTLYTGGQPISKNTARCLDKGLCKWFGVVYGASETSLILYNLVDKSSDFIEHSCGKPAPGTELKIVDDNGEIVPVYSRGELYVRSDAMFVGYYNDPDKTKAVVTEDGWYKTDDLAFMTEEGLFYIEGRKSDVFTSGAMNVSPTILEAILINCPGVKDVMVVPLPHETLYQVICACFIPESGSGITENHVRQYCEEMHADKPRIFTVLPTFYLCFETFPEVATGKTSRRKLTEEAILRVRAGNTL